MYDVVIIGAGAVGSFVARNLSRYKIDVLVLEKDLDAADETTMANSAISHSGYDPVPGTLKAKMNVAGNKMMPKVCKELDVPYEKCGTLTIAFNDEEIKRLKELEDRAKQNGVLARIVDQNELFAMEPNVNKEAKAALLCEEGGIVNPFLLAIHALENAVDNGVKLHLGEEVTSLAKENEYWRIETSKGEYEAKVVINASGVHSDDIARMAGEIDWKIKPRKGEYYVLNHYAKGLVNHVLFSLPSEKGKGVLVTMTTSGNYLVGPSSEETPDKEDLSTDAPTLSKVKEQAMRLVPSIPFGQSIRVYSGLRATPSTHDFILGPSNGDPSFINAAGIESPGLVSSPAIGEYLVEEYVVKHLNPEKNADYTPYIKPYSHPKEMSEEERNEFIKRHPEYGHIICDCEQVSLGEIKEAISRSVPCLTVKAVKKRTRAGFGKCQGGFCMAKVLAMLAEKEGGDLSKVEYGKANSPVVLMKVSKGEKR